jgi:hypothetical protein
VVARFRRRFQSNDCVHGPTLGAVKLRNRRLGHASSLRCHDTAVKAGHGLFNRASDRVLITDAPDNFAAPQAFVGVPAGSIDLERTEQPNASNIRKSKDPDLFFLFVRLKRRRHRRVPTGGWHVRFNYQGSALSRHRR